MTRNIILLIMMCWVTQINAQVKDHTVAILLDSLSNTSVPQLNNEVDISFSNIKNEPDHLAGFVLLYYHDYKSFAKKC